MAKILSKKKQPVVLCKFLSINNQELLIIHYLLFLFSISAKQGAKSNERKPNTTAL